jgi:hypothetical protein
VNLFSQPPKRKCLEKEEEAVAGGMMEEKMVVSLEVGVQ